MAEGRDTIARTPLLRWPWLGKADAAVDGCIAGLMRDVDGPAARKLVSGDEKVAPRTQHRAKAATAADIAAAFGVHVDFNGRSLE
jgi:hypothetical protein